MSDYICGHSRSGFVFINNEDYCFSEHVVWLDAFKDGRTQECPKCFWRNKG